MRRDMDLLRDILLAVERNADPFELVTPNVEGHAEIEVCRHIALLVDAGLVTGLDRSAIGVYYWSAGQLTWAGHEFLDLVRETALWETIKGRVMQASGGLAFGVLIDEAAREVHRRIAASEAQ